MKLPLWAKILIFLQNIFSSKNDFLFAALDQNRLIFVKLKVIYWNNFKPPLPLFRNRIWEGCALRVINLSDSYQQDSKRIKEFPSLGKNNYWRKKNFAKKIKIWPIVKFFNQLKSIFDIIFSHYGPKFFKIWVKISFKTI